MGAGAPGRRTQKKRKNSPKKQFRRPTTWPSAETNQFMRLQFQRLTTAEKVGTFRTQKRETTEVESLRWVGWWPVSAWLSRCSASNNKP